ncbi:DUF559 domain-containing protein [candidate division WOR-3 bacterium]|nr:DUF559 domain-containing protein [candidate division WOR-3 bacterium]
MMTSRNSRVLVAILKNIEDLDIAKNLHWYRIPVESAEKWLSRHWPPYWLAFYQPKIFKGQEFSVRYYAKVLRIERAKRWQLFPQKRVLVNSEKEYDQIRVSKLLELERPIISLRKRRIIFINTTYFKLLNALEINDLYRGSEIEEALWRRLKNSGITAERQELIKVGKKNYFLDFAIYCRNGKIDVEADGDFWHHNSKKARNDNERNNDLSSSGWHVLRFTSEQIFKENGIKCVEKIGQTMEFLGEKNVLKKPARPTITKKLERGK